MKKFEAAVDIRAEEGKSLTLDEMKAKLPSIFADGPSENRSPRYRHIATNRVVEKLMECGYKPVAASAIGTIDPVHARHLIRFRTDNDKLRVGDSIFEIVLRNSHDGSAYYEFLGGLYRLACLNGMTVSQGVLADVRIKHTGRWIMDRVLAGAEQIVKAAPLAIEAPKRWSKIELTDHEREAFAARALAIRYGDDHHFQPFQVLEPRRADDVGNDLWLTFQRIQENIIKGGARVKFVDANGASHHRTMRPIKAIDKDVNINMAMWQVADDMAKLKEAA
jgi:hypothetical protein